MKNNETNFPHLEEASLPRKYRGDPRAKAEALGMTLVYPKADEIFIDLDSQEELEEHHLRWEFFCAVFPGAERRFTKSRNGNVHVYITLPFLIEAVERIALEACLGGDYRRQMILVSDFRESFTQSTSLFFEFPGTIPSSEIPTIDRPAEV